jgi:ribosomal protein L14E/L6E/L27E
MILKIIDHNASTEIFDKENIVKIEKKNYKKIHLL